MASDEVVKRRRCGGSIKAQVLAECEAPGAAVAKVAMAQGMNANVVHSWRQLARQCGQATLTEPGDFVPVAFRASAPVASRTGGSDIEVDLRRVAVMVRVIWPSSATADVAARTRELLR